MNYSKDDNRKNIRNIKSVGKRAKNKVGIMIFRVVIAVVLIGVFGLAGAGVGAYLGILENSPKLSDIQLTTEEGGTSVIYQAETGIELVRLDGGETREFAPASKIPKTIKDAFVAIEDERFYEHDGVDLKGFVRATYQTLFEDSKQGGSTITQQLIKNKLGIKRNTIDTKLQEQYLAVEYEKNLAEGLGGSKAKAKDHIISSYLNSIALGSGQIGVQAASLRYFGKDVEDLTLDECAVIAATTQNPTGNNPIHFPENNAKRATTCLNKMLELGFITDAEYKAARRKVSVDDMLEKGEITKTERDELKGKDVYSRIMQNEAVVQEQSSVYSYYIDRVINDVISDLKDNFAMTPQEASMYLYNGGLSVNAAIDLEIQAILDEAFMNDELFPQNEYDVAVTGTISVIDTLTEVTTHHDYQGTVKDMDSVDAFVDLEVEKLLGQNGKLLAKTVYPSPQPQAGMVVLDYHTGLVKGVAGGRGEKLTNRGLNRGTDAKRQPGSVFKILASYAPSIDMGLITPATVIDDIPYSYGSYSPRNWYGGYWGLSTMREGVTQSMNVITVKNLNNMGVDNMKKYLLNFGFSTLVEDDWQLATALGGITYGVTQLEVTAAFGAIANEGVYIKPTFYTTVLNHKKEVQLENVAEPIPVLKKTSAFLLTDMMKDVLTRGTGGQASFRGVKMPVAGKTGTTTDNKELTFVGFTPYYVAGVYLGYDMPKPMSKNTKSDHMRLWRFVMEKIHENLEYKDFPRPDGIVSASICQESGQLAMPGLCDADPRGSRIRSEYFASGTVPTEYCQVHYAYDACIDSDLSPGPFCPDESIEHRVGIIRPVVSENSAVASDAEFEVPQTILDEVLCDIHLTPIDEMADGLEDPLVIDGPGFDTPISDITPTPTPAHETTPALPYTPNNGQGTPTPPPTPKPTTTPTPMPEVTKRPDDTAENHAPPIISEGSDAAPVFNGPDGAPVID